MITIQFALFSVIIYKNGREHCRSICMSSLFYSFHGIDRFDFVRRMVIAFLETLDLFAFVIVTYAGICLNVEQYYSM